MRFVCVLLAGLAPPAPVDAATVGEEIVVTADRRGRPVADAPQSINRISGDEILRVGADHPAELLNRSPGVLIHRGSGQEHLTAIRSPVLTGGAGAGSFLFLEDGVPLRAAGFANVNGLFEAHTEIAGAIEVLRGPPGALYGANAVHGAINVLTPAPSDRLRYAEISGDTIGRVKGRAVASFDAEGGGFLIGLSILDDPGFRLESGVDQQKLTLRHDVERAGFSARTVLAAVNLSQETAGFVVGRDAYRDPILRRGNPNPEAFRDARAIRLSSRLEWRATDVLSVQTTPYVRWNDMTLLMHFVPSQALEETSHWSVGAQSAAYLDGERGSLVAGVDWEYTEGVLREFQSIPTVFSYTQGLHYDFDVAAIGVSPFVEARFEATSRLALVGGLRLDWTQYAYDNRTDDGVVGRFLRPPDRTDAFVTVSPKLSALYTVGDHVLRIAYARGARPPQTSDLYRLQINQTADPAETETLDSIEIGWRGRVADRVRFDVAGYFMEKSNFFFRDADGFNVPDGRTRHAGAEAEVSARLTDSLVFEGSAAYGRHTYRFSRPVLSVPQASESIRFGDDVDTSPRWIANTRLVWSPDSAPYAAEIEWARVGRYFADAANTAPYAGHNVLNLRGSWRFGGGLQAFAALRNVANSFYAERADFAFGEDRYFPAEGRVLTIGLRVGNQ